MARLGLGVRAATMDDLPWLVLLYGNVRADELAPVPWSDKVKRAFVAEQFRLQHLHYVTHFPSADFWILTRLTGASDARDVGRLYLDRAADLWRIVDISLMAGERGAGVGTACLEWIKGAAAAGGVPVALSVAHHNVRAAALYRQHGFKDAGSVGQGYRSLRWTPGVS